MCDGSARFDGGFGIGYCTCHSVMPSPIYTTNLIVGRRVAKG